MTTNDESLPRYIEPRTGLAVPSHASGGDYDWGLLIRPVWQALADPDGQHSLPSIDWVERHFSDLDEEDSERARLSGHFSIWTATINLMKYSLGWRSPAHGVAKWVDEGLPTDDPRLELIAHLLGRGLHEKAINLATFLFRQGGWAYTEYGHGGILDTYGSTWVDRDFGIPAWVDREFARRGCGDDRSDSEVEEAPDYLPASSGGWDNMHLSGHSWAPIIHTAIEQSAPMRTSHDVAKLPVQFHSSIDGALGHATLVTHQYAGWYDELVQRGNSLPPLKSGRSWRIEVICSPIGWLGTFRKSRETGLWFSGKHSMHVWGEWS